MSNTPFRFDPFRQRFRPVRIIAETCLCEYHESKGRTGFFLKEAVQLRSPSTVEITQNGAEFSEVARIINPSTGEFRVDYFSLTYYSESFVEVNPAHAGLLFIVSYHALGSTKIPSRRTDGRYNLPGSLQVAQNVDLSSAEVLRNSTTHRTTILCAESGAVISASGKRIQNGAEGITATDAMILDQLQADSAVLISDAMGLVT